MNCRILRRRLEALEIGNSTEVGASAYWKSCNGNRRLGRLGAWQHVLQLQLDGARNMSPGPSRCRSPYPSPVRLGPHGTRCTGVHVCYLGPTPPRTVAPRALMILMDRLRLGFRVPTLCFCNLSSLVIHRLLA